MFKKYRLLEEPYQFGKIAEKGYLGCPYSQHLTSIHWTYATERICPVDAPLAKFTERLTIPHIGKSISVNIPHNPGFVFAEDGTAWLYVPICTNKDILPWLHTSRNRSWRNTITPDHPSNVHSNTITGFMHLFKINRGDLGVRGYVSRCLFINRNGVQKTRTMKSEVSGHMHDVLERCDIFWV